MGTMVEFNLVWRRWDNYSCNIMPINNFLWSAPTYHSLRSVVLWRYHLDTRLKSTKVTICFILFLLISILIQSEGQVTCATGWEQMEQSVIRTIHQLQLGWTAMFIVLHRIKVQGRFEEWELIECSIAISYNYYRVKYSSQKQSWIRVDYLLWSSMIE